jgi:hypothetical protein
MRRSDVGPIIDIRSTTGLHGRHPNLLYPSTSILCCVSASGGRNGPRSLQRALRIIRLSMKSMTPSAISSSVINAEWLIGNNGLRSPSDATAS